jgi:hypothetical protein
MKGMLKLWQQVVLIQHAECRKMKRMLHLSMATSRTSPAYRRQEQIARQTNPPEIKAQENKMNAASMVTSCTNPSYIRWSKLLILIKEDWQESNHYFMTWQLSSILQVALWNEECHHGCGYIHLLSLSSSTKKKCCANGALSSVSCNFDEGLMMRFDLDEMPLVMRMVTTTHKFCQDCTKYNNLLAMAATKVCNYCAVPGFTN